MKTAARSLTAALALVALSGGRPAPAETTVDLALGSAFAGGEAVPSASAGIDCSAQRIDGDGPSLSLDFSADASRDLLDSGYSGSADLALAAYRLFGRTNVGVRLEAAGVLPADSLDGSLVASLAFPVTLNGAEFSLTVAPTVSVDPLASGYASAGMECGLSFLAGSFVLKPGVGVSILRLWDGGLAYALKPGLDVSWYPGFPASIALSGEYRLGEGDIGADWLAFECVGVAAPADRLLFTLSAKGYGSSSSSSLEILLETAFVLVRGDSGGEWSLPLLVGYRDDEGQRSIMLGAGARLAF